MTNPSEPQLRIIQNAGEGRGPDILQIKADGKWKNVPTVQLSRDEYLKQAYPEKRK